LIFSLVATGISGYFVIQLCIIIVNIQKEGMTVQAERLNYYRFLSHFRAVHRGTSFTKMRVTTVRKLLPEYVYSFVLSFTVTHSSFVSFFKLCNDWLVFRSWGFLCPVHTPDGTPCGLLNHMTAVCRKFLSPTLFFFLSHTNTYGYAHTISKNINAGNETTFILGS
jgi:RNA polymerase Rpb2, domain 3